MNNFCFDSCLLHVCIQIHFQPLKGQNRVAFRKLETSYLIFTLHYNNIADRDSAGPNQESVTQQRSPEVSSKERVLLLVSSGLNIQFNFFTQAEEGPNKVAFREVDTLHLIFTTTSLLCWEANNNIAVGESAGLDQDSVAIFMFKGMDTKSALPTAEKSEERDEGMMSLDSLFF